MTKIAKVTNQCSIDSFQFRIPLADVRSYDSCLTSKHLLVNEQGEVIEEKTANRKYRVEGQINGTGFATQIKKVRHTGRQNIDCILFDIPSKLLGANYFDGITQDNFPIIYDTIIGSGLANFSYDALMGAGVAADIDVKRDAYKPNDMDFPKYCLTLKQQAKPTTEIGKGCKTFNGQNEGQGIQFNTRNSATVASPFLKFYNKSMELHTKSLPFLQSNLRDKDISGLIRVESTIKNKQHFQRVLKHSNNTLGCVLSLSSKELEQFIIHAQRIHLDKVTAYQQRKPNQDLAGKDLMLFRFLIDSLGRGVSFYEVERFLLEGLEKTPKRRTRKLIIELHDRYLSEQKEGLESVYEGGLIL